jgi:hypothetical protein
MGSLFKTIGTWLVKTGIAQQIGAWALEQAKKIIEKKLQRKTKELEQVNANLYVANKALANKRADWR